MNAYHDRITTTPETLNPSEPEVTYIFEYRLGPEKNWERHDTRLEEDLPTPEKVIEHLKSRVDTWPDYEWRVVRRVKQDVKVRVGSYVPESWEEKAS